MKRVRTLKVRRHLIGVIAGAILGQDEEPLDRETGIPWIGDGRFDDVRGRGKGLLRIAIAEAPVVQHIARSAVMQARCAWLCRLNRINHRVQRLVRHLDRFERVLGNIAVHRDDDGNRLTDIAHSIDRQGKMARLRFNARDERRRGGRDIGAGDDSLDPL